MPYELFISIRYLKAKRKQAFISLISLISIGGVAVGVAALIIVLAVMTGFKNDVRDKILGTMAHILIQKNSGNIERAEELMNSFRQLPQIASISPFVSGEVMISAGENSSGVTIHGIDVNRPLALAHLEKNLLEGRIEFLKNKYSNDADPAGPQRDGIILGWELAKILGVFTNDDVTLVSPTGRVLPTGVVPKLKKMRVVGTFSSGFYEYDAGLAYISLTAAQKFFSVGSSVSGIEIRIDDPEQTSLLTLRLKHQLGADYTIRDWAEMNQSLFSAIKLEKLAMFLILALIVLVAAFNIISTLVMMVMEKHADIATLKSMGATSASIMKIFMFEGSVIGVVGTGIGAILGIAVCLIADTYKLIHLDGGMYFLDHLPFTLTVPDVSIVVVSALLTCFLSTIYPARQASKLDPVAVFRYE